MATERFRPYLQFNFLVDLGTGNTEGPQAGFQECSNFQIEMSSTDYRNGNERENAVRKITGLSTYNDVTLKRGVIGTLDLYGWVKEFRDGNPNGYRNVTIQLQSEDHSGVVMEWRLLRAQVKSYSAGPLNATGTDVAMEELVLMYERLEMS